MRMVRLLACAAALTYGSSAFAIFDVQVLAGKRWYEIDTNPKGKVASQEIDVAAHIDPIPLVPIAFGASAAMGTLQKGDLGDDVTEAKTFEASLEVMAWLPMVPVITPYARLKYPVMGTWVVEEKVDTAAGSQKNASTAKLSGFHLNVGAKWSPLPVVAVLFEVGRGMQQYQLDEVKVDGSKSQNIDDKKYTLSSNTVMLGVEIGL